MQRTSCSMQHATRGILHTVRCIQHATCNIQHITWRCWGSRAMLHVARRMLHHMRQCSLTVDRQGVGHSRRTAQHSSDCSQRTDRTAACSARAALWRTHSNLQSWLTPLCAVSERTTTANKESLQRLCLPCCSGCVFATEGRAGCIVANHKWSFRLV